VSQSSLVNIYLTLCQTMRNIYYLSIINIKNDIKISTEMVPMPLLKIFNVSNNLTDNIHWPLPPKFFIGLAKQKR
jgi:hypothetical protein